MLTRRLMISGLAVAMIAPAVMTSTAALAQTTPSAGEILRKLEARPRMRVNPQNRVTIREFKKRPDLRRMAPSIDIQSINFAFASAEIPPSQYGKVETIARAIRQLVERNRRARVLIEGHTDAVGSAASN